MGLLAGERWEDRWRCACVAALGLALLAAPLVPARSATVAPDEPPQAAEAEKEERGSAAAPPRTDLDVDPAELLGGALATLLQTVYEQYVGSAVTIPEEVQERLAHEYAGELERARYVVSPLAVRVLEAIDRFQGTSLGEGLHAVTVNDLIVFATDPPRSEHALWVWAHELHHVRQYEELGSIRDFARWYLRECAAVEQAADERANRALGQDVELRHCLG